MKIRLNPTVEKIVQRHPDFGSIKKLQKYINGNERQFYSTEHKEFLRGKPITLGESWNLQAGDLTMILRQIDDGESDFLVVKIMDTRRVPKGDRAYTVWAYPEEEEVVILPPMMGRRHPTPPPKPIPATKTTKVRRVPLSTKPPCILPERGIVCISRCPYKKDYECRFRKSL